VASAGRLSPQSNPLSVSTEAFHATTLVVLLRIPEIVSDSAGRLSEFAARKSSVLPFLTACLSSEVSLLEDSHLFLEFTAALLVSFLS